MVVVLFISRMTFLKIMPQLIEPGENLFSLRTLLILDTGRDAGSSLTA